VTGVSRSTTLVLSMAEDETAVRVVDELTARDHRVYWFDTDSFPRRAQVSSTNHGDGWRTTLHGPEDDLALSDVVSVWYRRPRAFDLDPSLGPGEQRFANLEAQVGLGGLLRAVDCLWVNHPDNIRTAEYKPFQLHLAAKAGLSIPNTLITNRPESARAFISEHDRVVYKTLGPPVLLQGGADGQHEPVFTTLMRPEHVDQLASVATTTCLFQEYVEKSTELRLTVIGSEIFPVEICYAKDREVVDWRSNYAGHDYRVYSLPDDIRAACLRLVDVFGLNFAAIDMVVTPRDEYVFLEINPNGQWSWLALATDLPMVESMADLLMSKP